VFIAVLTIQLGLGFVLKSLQTNSQTFQTTGASGDDARGVELERATWAAEKKRLLDEIASKPATVAVSNDPPAAAAGGDEKARWLGKQQELEAAVEKAKKEAKESAEAAKTANEALKTVSGGKVDASDPHWDPPSISKTGSTQQKRSNIC